MGPNDWLDTETEEQMSGLERSDWIEIAIGIGQVIALVAGGAILIVAFSRYAS